MLRYLRVAVPGLLLGALAANCSAQITSSNLGLKNWFSLQSWISDIAGVQGMTGFNGNDINALSALMAPVDVKTDRAGNVYIADFANNRIRMIQAGTGTLMTIAGSGGTDCSDPPMVAPLSGNLNGPNGLAIDAAGNIYVSELGNARIRMISADRTAMTVLTGVCNTPGYVGSDLGVPAATAKVDGPIGIAVNGHGNVIFADSANRRVRMIASGTVYDIAGTGATGYNGDNQPAVSATLTLPYGVAVDPSGTIYITDYLGERVRMIVDGIIYAVAGNGTTGNNCSVVGVMYPKPTDCQTNNPQGIAVNGYGSIVFTDSGNEQIKAVVAHGGSGAFLSPLTGSSSMSGYAGIPGNGRNFWSPAVFAPWGIDIDANGRIRFVDSGNDIVRLWRGESPLMVQTTNNTDAYEFFYQYDGVNSSYRYPNSTIPLPEPRTLAIGGSDSQLLVGTGDFNRDGNLDLVWEDQTTHQVTIWYQSGAGESGPLGAGGSGGCPCTLASQVVALIGSPDWHVAAVADFNGDGVPDLVYQNTTTGEVVIWNMTGTWGNIPLSLTYVPGKNNSPWVVVGAADFNGDGTPDLLWQNPATRQMLVWYVGAQGGSMTGYSVLDQALPGWTCIGTKDFDGNGKPDIFYQNDTTAEVMVWLMGGTGGQDSLNQVFLEYSPPTNWRYIAR